MALLKVTFFIMLRIVPYFLVDFLLLAFFFDFAAGSAATGATG
jgi:hypothetical protein